MDIVRLACEVAQRYQAQNLWLPDLRKSLRPVIGRQEAKSLRISREADAYLATLRVGHAIDMSLVMATLGTSPETTAEEIMRIVYERCCPSISAEVRTDAFDITMVWLTVFQNPERDEYQLMKHTIHLFRRLLEGLPETEDVTQQTQIYFCLMGAITYELSMANSMREILCSTPKDQ